MKASESKAPARGFHAEDGALTRVTFEGGACYAQRTSYKDYRFCIIYSEGEVFAGRSAILAVGLALYLALSAAVLVVRGFFDKRNLRATQKQLRIINAISATYETTFLLHLDTMRMESIKMSPVVAKTFAGHVEPHEFLNHVFRDARNRTFRILIHLANKKCRILNFPNLTVLYEAWKV